MIRNQISSQNAPRPALSPSGVRRGVGRPPEKTGFFQPVPLWVLAGSLLLMLCGLLTIYPLLTAACALTLPICASLLLFRGESPILFACCATQWLQVAIAILYCDFYGVELGSVLQAPEVERAAVYCLVGTLALAFGMRVALSSAQRNEVVGKVMLNDSSGWDMKRVFQLWIGSFFLGSIAETVGWYVTYLHQALLPLSNVKWVFFFVLSFLAMSRKSGYGLMATMASLEFVGGFLSPFSNFKEGLIMLLIAMIALRHKLNQGVLLLAVPVFFVGLGASVFWSSIKQEYRAFVVSSGGANASRVESSVKRLSWLADRVSRMNGEDFDEGLKSLIARVQYLSLVGQTIDHVPHYEPHANGKLWLGAIQHVMMPRIIFRNKAVLDDSERARKYTGLRLAGREEGTSIGIGYVAESYADLGFPTMFVPICLLGVFMGRMYQVSLRNKYSALLGAGIATAMVFSHVQMLEKSNVKIFGGLVVLCLAYWAMNKALGEPLIRWVCRRK